MEKKIKSMHDWDRALIYGCIVGFWMIIAVVLTNVLGIIDMPSQKIVIALAGGLVLILGTGSLLVLLRHLKDNCMELYSEEILNSSKMDEIMEIAA